LTELDYTKVLQDCLKNISKAKKQLYDLFSAQMFSICLRYSQNQEDAEDIFQQSFIKVFLKLHTINEPASLPGWIKSIFIREALDFYKKKKHTEDIYTMPKGVQIEINNDALQNLNIETIRNEIKKLPNKSRLVFNLYIIEGYTHAEIAIMLNISEGTSKSQLFEAKKRLKKSLTEIYAENSSDK